MKIKLELNLSENIEIYKDDILNEINKQFENQLKDNFKNLIRKAIQEAVEKEAINYKKQIKETVEYWIKTMPSTELFYTDGFREHLVDTAKTFQPQIIKILTQHIDSMDPNKIYEALGGAIGDKFYNFIKYEK